jgi:hypothetical protein
MTRTILLVLMIGALGLAQRPPAAEQNTPGDPVGVARRFLPPHSELGKFYTFDYRLGRVTKTWPAVLIGHILSPGSSDIVFAYYSPQSRHAENTLFITFLHKRGGDYIKVYELAYRAQVLFAGLAIRTIHLSHVPVDALAVITGRGASLGGHLQVLVWQDPEHLNGIPISRDLERLYFSPWGPQNVFPPNGSMEYFYFSPQRSGLEVALSAAHHPGINVTPPPVWFAWRAGRFLKIPAPRDALKRALVAE